MRSLVKMKIEERNPFPIVDRTSLPGGLPQIAAWRHMCASRTCHKCWLCLGEGESHVLETPGMRKVRSPSHISAARQFNVSLFMHGVLSADLSARRHEEISSP